jgi:HEAT repeat protein
MEMSNLDSRQIHERLQILKDSMNALHRKQAYDELITTDQEILSKFFIQVIKNEKDTETLANIAEVIIDSKVEDKVNLILPILQSDDNVLRRHICGLLSKYNSKFAIDVLIERLQTDPSAEVRVAAAYSLGKIGDKSALQVLYRAKDIDFSTDTEGVTVSQEASDAITAIEKRLN